VAAAAEPPAGGGKVVPRNPAELGGLSSNQFISREKRIP